MFTYLFYSLQISEQGCTPPGKINGVYYEPVKNDYQYNEYIEYHCEPGFRKTQGTSYKRKCGGLSRINAYYWATRGPVCDCKFNITTLNGWIEDA